MMRSEWERDRFGRFNELIPTRSFAESLAVLDEELPIPEHFECPDCGRQVASNESHRGICKRRAT